MDSEQQGNKKGCKYSQDETGFCQFQNALAISGYASPVG